MKIIKVQFLVFSSAVLLSLVGCKQGGYAVGVGPGITPEMRDKLQRETVRPPIDSNAKFVDSVVEADVPVPRQDYTRISAQLKLEEVLVGSKNIPRVVRTEPLTESWDAPGSRRRVVLADGNTALEELIEDHRPELYQYEVWNFTAKAGRFVAYAVGQFETTGDEHSTHVRWTYRFRPRGWPSVLFIEPFVRGEYHQFMSNGMDAIRKKVVEEWQSEGPKID